MVVVDRDDDRLLNAGGEQPGAGRQWASIATEPGSVTGRASDTQLDPHFDLFRRLRSPASRLPRDLTSICSPDLCKSPASRGTASDDCLFEKSNTAFDVHCAEIRHRARSKRPTESKHHSDHVLRCL